MFDKLKLLAKDTVIYGSSTIIARSLNYLLVPLYANRLSTFDNGIQTLVYANIAIANVLFSYGLETSYLKSASDTLHRSGDAKGYFSTAFFSLLVTSTLFAAVMVFFSADIAGFIGFSAREGEFINYAAVILWIDTLLVIPFAELRLKRKALQFAAARIIGVVAVVLSALVLLITFDVGLPGAFFANIIGSLVSLAVVLPLFRDLRPFFSFAYLREMLRIGLPYVPTGIAGLLIHLIDRNLLIRISSSDIGRIYGKGLMASDIVGIYGRVAAFGIILQLVIQVFRFAWQPFFLQHSNDPDAKRLFSYVMSISTLITMFAALAATFFVPDLVRHHYWGSFYILPPKYWIGLSVLPWIFLSYVFDMVSTNLSSGILVTGNTRYLPVVTFAGAAVTALGCWLLIPLGGMDGAAYAIVAGTVVMCLVMAYYSLKVFRNRYEWTKLLLLLVVGIFSVLLQEQFAMRIDRVWSVVSRVVLLFAYAGTAALLFREECVLLIRKLYPKRVP
ncbi:MAG: oligosaccharide flippase family protein [Chlorobium sp.]|uniref:lipopolysaccharide biosynthesis protein n=1 Tax=Chlorobium sp. TaxID=1095 RepID=UPI0025BB4F01|nr:oligosaccharide flippase family protein [Chlorobium sp.]MCF8382564.1 oligosaccharide flippase family protein [Chlorobium sp.]